MCFMLLVAAGVLAVMAILGNVNVQLARRRQSGLPAEIRASAGKPSRDRSSLDRTRWSRYSVMHAMAEPNARPNSSALSAIRPRRGELGALGTLASVTRNAFAVACRLEISDMLVRVETNSNWFLAASRSRFSVKAESLFSLMVCILWRCS